MEKMVELIPLHGKYGRIGSTPWRKWLNWIHHMGKLIELVPSHGKSIRIGFTTWEKKWVKDLLKDFTRIALYKRVREDETYPRNGGRTSPESNLGARTIYD
jgi:hypothetical protein